MLLFDDHRMPCGNLPRLLDRDDPPPGNLSRVLCGLPESGEGEIDGLVH